MSNHFHRSFFLVVEHMSFTTRLRLYSLIVIPPSLPTHKLFLFSIFSVYLLASYSHFSSESQIIKSYVFIVFTNKSNQKRDVALYTAQPISLLCKYLRLKFLFLSTNKPI